MEIPKFESLAGQIVNLNAIERIKSEDIECDSTTENYPFLISVIFLSGCSLTLEYKTQIERDVKFRKLGVALGAAQ